MHFDVVSKYKDKDINLPVRATADSAGYDFEIAEDIVIPSWCDMINKTLNREAPQTFILSELEKITKEDKIRPTLVPTGVKAYLDEGKYLELSVRSSCPLKYGLILANGVGRLF